MNYRSKSNYKPSKGKKMDGKPHETFQPDGVTPISVLVEQMRNGVNVRFNNLEFGSEEEVFPEFREDKDIVDRQEAYENASITLQTMREEVLNKINQKTKEEQKNAEDEKKPLTEDDK